MSTTLVHTPHLLGHCYMCGLTIFCGTCGNNMCNAGRGNDGKCPDCDSAAELLHNEFSPPVVYSAIRATREEIRAWQTRQLKLIPEMVGATDPNWVITHVLDIADRAFFDLIELERALAAAQALEVEARVRDHVEQDNTLLRWFVDHALLVQLIVEVETDSDRSVAVTALQTWMKEHPRPAGEPWF